MNDDAQSPFTTEAAGYTSSGQWQVMHHVLLCQIPLKLLEEKAFLSTIQEVIVYYTYLSQRSTIRRS